MWRTLGVVFGMLESPGDTFGGSRRVFGHLFWYLGSSSGTFSDLGDSLEHLGCPNGCQNRLFGILDGFWASFWEAFGSPGGLWEVIWELFGGLWEVFGCFFGFCLGKCKTMKSVVLL